MSLKMHLVGYREKTDKSWFHFLYFGIHFLLEKKMIDELIFQDETGLECINQPLGIKDVVNCPHPVKTD